MKSFTKYAPLSLVIAAFLLTALYVASAGGNFPLDDSWIHQTYGRNLGTLGEWAFYPGQPSAASTSPLYTVILSMGYRLGIEYHLWTHGVGALALALTGLIGWRLSLLLMPNRKGIAWIVGLALVGTWHLIWAAGSGMETGIFAMLTLAMIAYTSEVQTARPFHAIGLGVLAGLLMLTRPEGVLLAGMCGLALVIRFAAAKTPIHRIGVFVGVMTLAFGAVTAPYLLYNIHVTGGLLPNTAGAKRSQAAALFGLSIVERFVRLVIPLLAGGQVLLIPGMIAFGLFTVRRHRDQAVRWLLIAWGFGLIALYAAWLPLDMQHGRYVMPALPALIVVGVIGTVEWAVSVRRSLIGRVIVRSLAAAAALIFAAFAFSIGLSTYTRDVAIIDGDMVTAAAWVRDHIPADTLIAIHDIGAVGYFAPHPMLDIGGLISPEVIPIIRDGDAIWTLIEQRGARYLMGYPYQLPNENPDDPRLCPRFSTENPVTQTAGGSPLTIYEIYESRLCE
ncbi:MAG: hypothetical protein U0670_01360 [Anaerolineae bacterium]